MDSANPNCPASSCAYTHIAGGCSRLPESSCYSATSNHKQDRYNSTASNVGAGYSRPASRRPTAIGSVTGGLIYALGVSPKTDRAGLTNTCKRLLPLLHPLASDLSVSSFWTRQTGVIKFRFLSHRQSQRRCIARRTATLRGHFKAVLKDEVIQPFFVLLLTSERAAGNRLNRGYVQVPVLHTSKPLPCD